MYLHGKKWAPAITATHDTGSGAALRKFFRKTYLEPAVFLIGVGLQCSLSAGLQGGLQRQRYGGRYGGAPGGSRLKKGEQYASATNVLGQKFGPGVPVVRGLCAGGHFIQKCCQHFIPDERRTLLYNGEDFFFVERRRCSVLAHIFSSRAFVRVRSRCDPAYASCATGHSCSVGSRIVSAFRGFSRFR